MSELSKLLIDARQRNHSKSCMHFVLVGYMPPLQAAAGVSSLNWMRPVLNSVSSDTNSAGIR